RACDLRRAVPGRALALGQIDRAAGQRAERLLLVGRRGRQPEVVDRVGEQQHLHALGPARLELRAGAQRFDVLAADGENRVLAGPHARDVLGEADPAVARGAAEAGELEQALAPLVVRVDALLAHRARVLPAPA